jgi:hypothetical protein
VNQDNPNSHIIPGQPRYNPNVQSGDLGDAWLNQAYPGFIDPTQVPMSPGDTNRPMQPPPVMQQNNPTPQPREFHNLPSMPQMELLQALQNAIAFKSQMQGNGGYAQNPNTEARSRSDSAGVSLPQSYSVALPASQNTQVQPIVIPLVFELTFKIKVEQI